MVSFPVRGSTQAPAKINLHLAIGEKRNDGFHSLLSIFQMVDLFDRIELTIKPQPVLSVEIEMDGMQAVENNTMELAATLFLERVGITGEVTITCKKQIPEKAGLGGGSSDAAAVLLLLNRLYEYPLKAEQLLKLGSEIGSDVPFFLGDTPCACVEGRGEYLTPLAHRGELVGFIVMPEGPGISTAKAFAALDAHRGANGVQKSTLGKEKLIAMYAEEPGKWRFTNDFRAVVGSLAPLYDLLDNLMGEFPGCFGTLSGSGAAYIIIGEKKDEIEVIRTKLEKMAVNVTICDIKSLHRGHSGDTV